MMRALIILCLTGMALSDMPWSFQPTFTFDCGKPDKYMAFVSSSITPDPILYPGSVRVTLNAKVLKVLPESNFKMKLTLVKQTPFPMVVPCFRNFGSCEYDVCEMINNNQDIFCPIFPRGQQCGCPMQKGTYTGQNLPVTLPSIGGSTVAKIMEVSMSQISTKEEYYLKLSLKYQQRKNII
ncbi:ganglioside GM2 activator-like [Limulus polyphemus]|uniref:Ganglioside GM2 activator-like n=1 Tax=Limulus polyphemus TaxID=6850 RepID=A0ABM1C2I8_LIMPO|nr:ganglioside GM2 activator-like [Limulus polyphemus]